MRHDRNFKMVRMIPAPRTTTANGQTVSARTYGSGAVANNLKGIVDTLGYDRIRIEIRKQTGTAQKISKVCIGFQSGPSTLFASCSPLSGLTSGAILTAITTSAVAYAFDMNLATYASRKRYINCKVTTSTTSGNVDVSAYLYNAEQFPPSATGFTAITNYN